MSEPKAIITNPLINKISPVISALFDISICSIQSTFVSVHAKTKRFKLILTFSAMKRNAYTIAFCILKLNLFKLVNA
ncbi:MAG: hypothetical protein A2W85_05650 [Bacteroidetes bacterium GWF2_41_31]|nr:MAG: hypothetical protein A2W85_05650 [Bacteroidetes bacterium GWF2_41_31]